MAEPKDAKLVALASITRVEAYKRRGDAGKTERVQSYLRKVHDAIDSMGGPAVAAKRGINVKAMESEALKADKGQISSQEFATKLRETTKPAAPNTPATGAAPSPKGAPPAPDKTGAPSAPGAAAAPEKKAAPQRPEEPGAQELADLADKVLRRAAEVEPETTATLKEVTQAAGGTLDGLPYRFKTPESLTRKIGTKANEKGITPAEYADKVGDALRYTAVVEPDKNIETGRKILTALQGKGHKVGAIENSWGEGGPYYGTNIEMIAPNGMKWELQLHTPDSLERKHTAHYWYEIYRDEKQPKKAKDEATAKSAGAWLGLQKPKGWADFGKQLYSTADKSEYVGGVEQDMPDSSRIPKGAHDDASLSRVDDSGPGPESALVRLSKLVRVEAHKRRSKTGKTEHVDTYVRKQLDAAGFGSEKTKVGAYTGAQRSSSSSTGGGFDPGTLTAGNDFDTASGVRTGTYQGHRVSVSQEDPDLGTVIVEVGDQWKQTDNKPRFIKETVEKLAAKLPAANAAKSGGGEHPVGTKVSFGYLKRFNGQSYGGTWQKDSDGTWKPAGNIGKAHSASLSDEEFKKMAGNDLKNAEVPGATQRSIAGLREAKGNMNPETTPPHHQATVDLRLEQLQEDYQKGADLKTLLVQALRESGDVSGGQAQAQDFGHRSINQELQRKLRWLAKQNGIALADDQDTLFLSAESERYLGMLR